MRERKGHEGRSRKMKDQGKRNGKARINTGNDTSSAHVSKYTPCFGLRMLLVIMPLANVPPSVV